MKSKLLCALSFSVLLTVAHAADTEVNLVGVVSGLGEDSAVIEIRTAGRRTPEVVDLKPGQAMGGVEIFGIEPAKGAVSVAVNGGQRKLSLPADWDYGTTNELDPGLPVMYFRALPLQEAIKLYADNKKRTMLLHPKLGNPTLSLKMNARTPAEAAEAWEKLFHEHNVATIPDGEDFVMVVPSALTNAVTPRAATIAPNNSSSPMPLSVPAMSVVFRNAPIQLVLQTYADFVHKEIVNLQDNSWSKSVYPLTPVTFVQTTPLSREEISYALQTLIEWRDIRIAPAADGKFKLEQIPDR